MPDKTQSPDGGAKYGEYSADVDIYMLVGNAKLPVSRVGPSHAVLHRSVSTPAGSEATIVIVVDGEEHRYQIVLCQPMDPGTRYVDFF